MNTAAKNIVLVHGGFADGSGWQGVYDLLTSNGHTVSIVQNPTLSLEGDADATRWVLDAQDGPVVLVGHSYGGAVITEAGTHDKVAALVYIAAFAPDKGESVNTLIADPPPGAPVPPILPPRDGFLLLDRDKFHGSFAADLPANQAAFMADAQVPWGGGGPRRIHHRPGLADQAELVPGRHRGPHDPPAGPAPHVRAGRLHRGRGHRQPRHLRLPAGRGGRTHRAGRRRGSPGITAVRARRPVSQTAQRQVGHRPVSSTAVQLVLPRRGDDQAGHRAVGDHGKVRRLDLRSTQRSPKPDATATLWRVAGRATGITLEIKLLH
jgi:pimeloyl-ACP methyl ester carboxylesterase